MKTLTKNILDAIELIKQDQVNALNEVISLVGTTCARALFASYFYVKYGVEHTVHTLETSFGTQFFPGEEGGRNDAPTVEKLWCKLMNDEKVILATVLDVLTNRHGVAASIHIATNSVAILRSGNHLASDSTKLRPGARLLLEKILQKNDIINFEELYRKLVALI